MSKDKKKTKSGKRGLARLFASNRFTVLFSFFTAIIVWLFVAIQFSPVETRTIEDVPVTIDLESSALSKFGLQIFGQSSFTVDVTVSGKRYEISSAALSADDISAVAQTNYVDSSGKHQLSLKVSPKSDAADYQIKDYSADFIEVYFDEYMEKTFELTPSVVAADIVVPDGYISDDLILSADSVIVSGPKTEIEKISTVAARVTLDEPITDTKTFEAEIIPLNELGGVLRYLTVNTGGTEITLTVPVYQIKVLPASVEFLNFPSAYSSAPLPYTVSPEQLSVGLPRISAVPAKSVSVAQIDFASLSAGINTIEIPASELNDYILVGDYTDTVITVTIDASELSEASLTIPAARVKLLNAPEGFTASLSGGIDVTAVGPSASLETLSVSDINAVLDLSDAVVEDGKAVVSEGLYFDSSEDCWIKNGFEATVTLTAVPAQ